MTFTARLNNGGILDVMMEIYFLLSNDVVVIVVVAKHRLFSASHGADTSLDQRLLLGHPLDNESGNCTRMVTFDNHGLPQMYT